MNDLTYGGEEITLFAEAANWKKYFGSKIRPFIGKRVVEVGAGIGATTEILCDGLQQQWICLEPDPLLRAEIEARIASRKLPACCSTRAGVVADLEFSQTTDSFVYIDVLEHIQDDGPELDRAAERLAPGGTLIVLGPAFNFLYSPFDESVGHYRRYDKLTLQALTPPACRVKSIFYLDCVGMATSLFNKFVLKQPLPNQKQILFWDRWLVPISRATDPVVGYKTGRSIVCVWEKVR
jgi:SAM-dependent methyltransferase